MVLFEEITYSSLSIEYLLVYITVSATKIPVDIFVETSLWASTSLFWALFMSKLGTAFNFGVIDCFKKRTKLIKNE